MCLLLGTIIYAASLSTTHIHTHTHAHTHIFFDIISPPSRLPARANIHLCLTPSSLPFPNSQSKSRHPNSHIHAVARCLFFFLLHIFLFTVLSQTISRLFSKTTYKTSYVYVLTCTCVRYMVGHVNDTEPSVHMY
jgi:hypothetical protein